MSDKLKRIKICNAAVCDMTEMQHFSKAKSRSNLPPTFSSPWQAVAATENQQHNIFCCLHRCTIVGVTQGKGEGDGKEHAAPAQATVELLC
eukprot:1156901-Pelagomonas_calceolata.AAC.6